MTNTVLIIIYIANWWLAAYNVSNLITLGNSMHHWGFLSIDIAFIIVLTMVLNAKIKAAFND